MSKYSQALRKVQEQRDKKKVSEERPALAIGADTAKEYQKSIQDRPKVSVNAASHLELGNETTLRKSSYFFVGIGALVLIVVFSIFTWVAPRFVGEKAPAQEIESVESQNRYYTIQLVTYKSKERVAGEVERLQFEGYPAFAYQLKDYHLLCIGKYKSQLEANEKLAEIIPVLGKETYQDAFVRFVRSEE